MYKLMIVEDDEVIANSIAKYLEKWNFEVYTVQNFQNVVEEYVAYSPHLVIMDIHLPYYDGYYFCKEIRKLSKVPIIFLSSSNEDMNIVMAMSLGGDEFIEKPFKLIVLKAKIEALLRRVYNFNIGNNLITYRGLIYDVSKDKVKFKDEEIDLTKNEGKILYLLLEERGKIVSRDDIMIALWESDSFVDENTLSVNVNRLRSKLKLIGVEDFIITKKGKGYIV